MELTQKFDLSKLETDKYLKWYEDLTTALQSYRGKKTRMDHLEKVCDYLEKRFFKNILLNTVSGELLKHFTEEKKKLQNEIRDIIRYTGDLGYNPYFIPILSDWEYLHFCRPLRLKDRQAEYLMELKRSVLNNKDFASFKFDEISNDIFSSDFYCAIILGEPILKSFITKNSFIDVSGWKIFCHWIYEIDYAKWLLEKTKGLERYESAITPTVAGVVLLFHYLSDNNGESLYDPGTLQKVSTKYNLSKDRIKRELSKFRSTEIIMVGNTTNEKRAKFNELQFAVTELKKLSNSNALNEALRHFNIIKEKLN
jgi:hypothetical protein